jgi:DNA helicase HerA-like ATPase
VIEPFPYRKTADGADVEFMRRMGIAVADHRRRRTGKTVSLQLLADHFSQIGVPVFLADVKGDLSGVATAGTLSPRLKERLASTGNAQPEFSANPAAFWDVAGRRGFPVRATISDVGPLLLGRLFNLNPTQQGVLSLVFKAADEACSCWT